MAKKTKKRARSKTKSKKTKRKTGAKRAVRRGVQRRMKLPAPSRYQRTCPECGGRSFMEDQTRGELVCTHCGLVLKEDIIDTGQEWRAFDSEQMKRRARGGAPLTFTKHDKGLTTEIGKGLGELYKVPARKRYKVAQTANKKQGPQSLFCSVRAAAHSLVFEPIKACARAHSKIL